MIKKMSKFKNKYAGRPAAVLGGGPSLPDDMKKLPKGCLLIAVNYHAFYLCKPDFMVYNDFPESNPLLLEAVQAAKAVRVHGLAGPMQGPDLAELELKCRYAQPPGCIDHVHQAVPCDIARVDEDQE